MARSAFGGKILNMKFDLALVQIATRLGDVQANLEKHLGFIKQARVEKADLIVFPELSLTGYVLQDLVASVAHHPVDEDPVFQPLLKASRDIDMVVGFVDEDSRHRFLYRLGLPIRRPGAARSSQALFADIRPLR